MAHYFGFQPTEELSNMIDDSYQLVDSGSKEPYYPKRNDISHQIGHEVIDNLLVNLISVIPDENRQNRLRKITSTIESAKDTLLNILLGKDKNKDVMPTVDYLRNETDFVDNNGDRRIGFKLPDEKVAIILEGFDSVTEESADKAKLKKALNTMNHAVIGHFVLRFAETLPLGMFKRKAVPVATSAINKALDIAVNSILPDLPLDSLNRLVNFFRPFIVEKD